MAEYIRGAKDRYKRSSPGFKSWVKEDIESFECGKDAVLIFAKKHFSREREIPLALGL